MTASGTTGQVAQSPLRHEVPRLADDYTAGAAQRRMGVNNNGNHSANGIAALFAATGQDIANVAESSAALVHTDPQARQGADPHAVLAPHR